ncbi:hypothetical protein K440DRAFT_378889 [Wilcoxina mikolae CBS 423.85]|nr:hypothetical protein K440DRAFT_378889 [Wilcoxina mikolae CBS 423.85]
MCGKSSIPLSFFLLYLLYVTAFEVAGAESSICKRLFENGGNPPHLFLVLRFFRRFGVEIISTLPALRPVELVFGRDSNNQLVNWSSRSIAFPLSDLRRNFESCIIVGPSNSNQYHIPLLQVV